MNPTFINTKGEKTTTEINHNDVDYTDHVHKDQTQSYFSIRIVDLDYYLCKPTEQYDVIKSPLDNSPIQQVPIVRIFGSTPAGQKCCLHLHNLFPYFFIQYHDDLPLENDHVNTFIRKLVASINIAMVESNSNYNGQPGRKPNYQHLQQQQQHIFNIKLTKGRPFYGYYPNNKIFIKIFLYNPDNLNKIANLLRSGVVMGRKFDVYEAHIPFLLQVFLDYNLSGMSFIDFTRIYFRSPLPQSKYIQWDGDEADRSQGYDRNTTTSPDHQLIEFRKWFAETCPADSFQYWSAIKTRKTTCELEVDGLIGDTTNINYNSQSPPIPSPNDNDGGQTEKEKKLVQSLRLIWDDEVSRRKTTGLPTQFTQVPTQERKPIDLGYFAKPLAHKQVEDIIQLERNRRKKYEKSKVNDQSSNINNNNNNNNNNNIFQSSQPEVDIEILKSIHNKKTEENLNHIYSQMYSSIPLTNNSGSPESKDPFIQFNQKINITEPPPPQQPPQQPTEQSIPPPQQQQQADDDESEDENEHDEIDIQTQNNDIINTSQFAANFFTPVQSWSDGEDDGNPKSQGKNDRQDKSWSDSGWGDDTSDQVQSIPQYDGGMDEKTADKGNGSSKHSLHQSFAPINFGPNHFFHRNSQLTFQPQQPQSKLKSFNNIHSPPLQPKKRSYSTSSSSSSSTSQSKHYNIEYEQPIKPNTQIQLKSILKKNPTITNIDDDTKLHPNNRNNRKRVKFMLPIEEDGSQIVYETPPYIFQKNTTSTTTTTSASTVTTTTLLSIDSSVTEKSPPKPHYSPPKTQLAQQRETTTTSDIKAVELNTLPNQSTSFSLEMWSPVKVDNQNSSPTNIFYSKMTTPPSGSPQIAILHPEESPLKDKTVADYKIISNSPATKQTVQMETQQVDVEPLSPPPPPIDSIVSITKKPPRLAPQETTPSPPPPPLPISNSSPGHQQDQDASLSPPPPLYIQPSITQKKILRAKDEESVEEKEKPHEEEEFLDSPMNFIIHEPSSIKNQRQQDDQNDSMIIESESEDDQNIRSIENNKYYKLIIQPNSQGSELMLDNEDIEQQQNNSFIFDQNHRPPPITTNTHNNFLNDYTPSFSFSTPSNESINSDGIQCPTPIHHPFINPPIPHTAGTPPTMSSFKIFKIEKEAPTNKDIELELINSMKPINIYKRAHFSNTKDDHRLYLDKTVPFQSKLTKGIGQLKLLQPIQQHRPQSDPQKLKILTPAIPPPCPNQLLKEFKKDNEVDGKQSSYHLHHQHQKKKQDKQTKPIYQTNDYSQISQTTPTLSYLKQMCGDGESAEKTLKSNLNQFLTLLSVEVHVNTRSTLNPNPETDPVLAIAYVVRDEGASEERGDEYRDITGLLIIAATPASESDHDTSMGMGCPVRVFRDERALLKSFTSLVRSFDVDILVGFEVQFRSIGYLIERARWLGISLCDEVSRLISHIQGKETLNKSDNYFVRERDRFGYDHSSGIQIVGRIVLNVWRLLRHEITLDNYSFENLSFYALHQRVPQYSHEKLTSWYGDPASKTLPPLRWKALRYALDRAKGSLNLIQHFDIIGRSSEFARVYGIDFFSVLSRGSQFRVESMLLRLTKPENYILYSPSREQTTNQPMPESIPLVMDPATRLYDSPVAVLDFQSLYPSIMIAHNYCYSTCLGRVQPTREKDNTKNFGSGTITIQNGLVEALQENNCINISPNGVMYVKSDTRRGIFPKLLSEVLETRIMVKRAMKKYKDNKRIYKMLDSRQIGLKLMANVAYGYTSATFSGRMSCIELGDSIVQTARETLESAIKIAETGKEFNCSVVYGDTDSMFILFPGRTRQDAFQMAQKVADRVTSMSPKPVKLILEKVYHPCILVNKKRYVGYKYETPSPTEIPSFDAKGIETIRRDSCKLVSKTLERSIRILFEQKDLSAVKDYLMNQIKKILQDRVSLRDFVFAKGVKMTTYVNAENGGALPAAAHLARRLIENDPRAEPRHGERVRYVVVFGHPNSRLCDLVVTPIEFLANRHLRINTLYYITKQIIPALDRVFKLVGANIPLWFNQLSKSFPFTFNQKLNQFYQQPKLILNGSNGNNQLPQQQQQKTIDEFYNIINCFICCNNLNNQQHHTDGGERITTIPICNQCNEDGEQTSYFIMMNRLATIESQRNQLYEICHTCSNDNRFHSDIECTSLDCETFFERVKMSTLYNNILRWFNQQQHQQQQQNQQQETATE